MREEIAILGREDGNDNDGGNDGGYTALSSSSRKGDGVGGEPSMNSLWVPFVHFGV